MFNAEYLERIFTDVENKECEFEIVTNIPKSSDIGTEYVTFSSLISKGKDLCRVSETTIVEVVAFDASALVLRKTFKKVLLKLDEPKGYTHIVKTTLHHVPYNNIVDVVFIEQETEKFSKKL